MRDSFINCAIFLMAAGLLLSSCQKEQFQLDRLSDEIEIETGLVAPLIYGSMGMGELVEEFDSTGYVDAFEDGLIYLAYSDTIAEVMVDSLDLFTDGLYTQIYFDTEIASDPFFLSSSVGDTVHFIKSKFFGFEMEGESRLDSIIFKGGDLLTEIVSTFQHAGFLTISSPYILDPGGNTYSHTVMISDPSGSFTWSETQDLDGYTLYTDKQGDSSIFRLDYDFALINSGNPVNPGEYCEINTSFLDFGFYKLFGFVDPDEVVSESGVLDIPVYADYPDLELLKVADPRIFIRTESSLGLPFVLTLDNVIGTAGDGSTETLEFYSGHPFEIPAPSIDMIGQSAIGEFYVNNQTSNIQDLLNIAPHSLSYEVMVDIGNQNQDHFLLDTSRFMAEMEFLLPLDLSFAEYTLSDTFGIDIGGEGIDTTVLERLVVNLQTVNELPIELGIQVYLLDAAWTVLDSLFDGDPVFLASSEVDNDGKLLQASENSHEIDFPAEKLGLLEETEYILVEARMVTAESGTKFVKFYTDYSLDFELSFAAEVRINTREI